MKRLGLGLVLAFVSVAKVVAQEGNVAKTGEDTAYIMTALTILILLGAIVGLIYWLGVKRALGLVLVLTVVLLTIYWLFGSGHTRGTEITFSNSNVRGYLEKDTVQTIKRLREKDDYINMKAYSAGLAQYRFHDFKQGDKVKVIESEKNHIIRVRLIENPISGETSDWYVEVAK